MSIKPVLIVLAIIAFGSIATLVSWFYKQDLSVIGMSRVGYGFPFSWYMESQIVYPGTPIVTSFSWEHFALNSLFWSLIAAIPVAIVYRKQLKKGNANV